MVAKSIDFLHSKQEIEPMVNRKHRLKFQAMFSKDVSNIIPVDLVDQAVGLSGQVQVLRVVAVGQGTVRVRRLWPCNQKPLDRYYPLQKRL